MSQTVSINEMFFSIQGESTRVGQPCVFIRLSGCHLRCRYCDTEYAFHEGGPLTVEQVIARADELAGDWPLVEITGGEPLLQSGVFPLMTAMCNRGRTVLVETSGACDISRCDERVIRIVDVKTPGSDESERNLWSNMSHLREIDEVKFVITSKADYEWSKQVIEKYDLLSRVHAVLMSPVHAVTPGRYITGCHSQPMEALASWILADRLGVVLQTQLHKLIWSPTARGV